jgi:hypothetical protein
MGNITESMFTIGNNEKATLRAAFYPRPFSNGVEVIKEGEDGSK